jgi:hypothetical protein
MRYKARPFRLATLTERPAVAPVPSKWMRQGCTVGFRELRKCRRVSSGLRVPEGDIHSMAALTKRELTIERATARSQL